MINQYIQKIVAAGAFLCVSTGATCNLDKAQRQLEAHEATFPYTNVQELAEIVAPSRETQTAKVEYLIHKAGANLKYINDQEIFQGPKGCDSLRVVACVEGDGYAKDVIFGPVWINHKSDKWKARIAFHELMHVRQRSHYTPDFQHNRPSRPTMRGTIEYTGYAAQYLLAAVQGDVKLADINARTRRNWGRAHAGRGVQLKGWVMNGIDQRVNFMAFYLLGAQTLKCLHCPEVESEEGQAKTEMPYEGPGICLDNT